jgi:ElaB/YqjD/DUF883 family membrane-anchored ribosome-binding protein
MKSERELAMLAAGHGDFRLWLSRLVVVALVAVQALFFVGIVTAQQSTLYYQPYADVDRGLLVERMRSVGCELSYQYGSSDSDAVWDCRGLAAQGSPLLDAVVALQQQQNALALQRMLIQSVREQQQREAEHRAVTEKAHRLIMKVAWLSLAVGIAIGVIAVFMLRSRKIS